MVDRESHPEFPLELRVKGDDEEHSTNGITGRDRKFSSYDALSYTGPRQSDDQGVEEPESVQRVYESDPDGKSHTQNRPRSAHGELPDQPTLPPNAKLVASDITPVHAEEQQTEANPIFESVPLRGDAASKQKSFQKVARLSQMLAYESTSSSSSSDDEELDRFYADTSIALQQKLSLPFDARSDASPQRSLSSLAAGANRASETDEAEQYHRDSVPMHILQQVVNPDVLMNVKSHLGKVAERQRSFDMPDPVQQSPATLWELRKQQRSKKILSKVQSGQIKAGWRVRQCLNSLPEGENVNTFYLTCVRRGLLREVDALFSLAKVDPSLGFNKNFKDADEKSAMSTAVECKNTAMMSKLLEYDVSLGMCIFHVISMDFTEGLKLLLSYDTCTDHKIEGENNYFNIRMTPMLLAAHNNNYKMLSLLHEYGHRLMKSVEWSEGIHDAWESANERRIICKARAQPAYITLMAEVNHMDPMDYCLKEIKKMRVYQHQEHEFSTFYKELIGQLEDYMCSLLDLICSSEEMAHVFGYEHRPLVEKRRRNMKKWLSLVDASANRMKHWSRFQLLEKASEEHLVRFVTHQQSQLALSYLRYRSMPVLRSQNVVLRNVFATTLGLLFPLLSLFYIISPKSKLGSIIAVPSISFSCHLASDIIFSLLLLINISMKNVSNYYLGASPTALEWLIFMWILGKWVQEFQECSNRGFKAYFRDNWNYTDIILLFLFSIGIVLRFSDFLMNRKKAHLHIPRSQWNSDEPRLLAEGLQAWAYVFVFLRMLGIMRVDRNLGPLQISLAKMLGDILRFLCIFLLVICAFAFGLSELYWYYGTDDGAKMLCTNGNNSSGALDQATCSSSKITVFSSMGRSFINLFWALFGLLDINALSLSGKHVYTEYVGRSLVAVYHAVAIIVMLNMLIAMMSKSYEDTSSDEETEWKFHRTAMWIRFIRREVIRPPPMNLFPNPWRLKENFARMRGYAKRVCCCRKRAAISSAYDKEGHRLSHMSHESGRKYTSLPPEQPAMSEIVLDVIDDGTKPDEDTHIKPKMHLIGRGTENPHPHVSKAVTDIQTTIRANFQAKKNKECLKKLVRRYKLKHLT